MRHTTPVVYTTNGDRLVIIASKAGAPNSPAWYHNLVAAPTATVELGSETFDVDAEITKGEERDRLYAHQAELMPAFAEYQTKTTSVIPVDRAHAQELAASASAVTSSSRVAAFRPKWAFARSRKAMRSRQETTTGPMTSTLRHETRSPTPPGTIAAPTAAAATW